MPSMDRTVQREMLLPFWKIHILHHAQEHPIYGLWMLEELAENGYRLSPGTLYPVLARMERNGWLASRAGRQANARREYRLTRVGRGVLALVRGFLVELHRELVLERTGRSPARPLQKRRPAGSRRA
jgi:PadR family transcriptional regulator, regulatory protein PadR